LTFTKVGHDFDCETLKNTADWVKISNKGDTRCSYCTSRQTKNLSNWGWGVVGDDCLVSLPCDAFGYAELYCQLLSALWKPNINITATVYVHVKK
jgi:hypothetical protein